MRSELKFALERIVKHFEDIDVTIIGDVFLDVYHDTLIRTAETEDTVPISDIESTHFQAGGAATLARICAGLGLKSRLIGVIGNDVEADLLADVLSKHMQISAFLSRTNERPTPTKTRYRDRGQLRFRADRESTKPISESCADSALRAALAHAPFSDYLFIADYQKGSHPLWKLGLFKEAATNCFIAADSRAGTNELPRNLNLLKKNRFEWNDIAIEVNDRLGSSSVAGFLATHYGTREVQVTLDTDGMQLLSAEGELARSETYAKLVVSETSAGNAAFVLCALARSIGVSPSLSLALASAAAACTLSKPGSEVVSLGDLEAFIETLPK